MTDSARLMIGVSDRFLVIRLGQDETMLPEGAIAQRVVAAVASLRDSYSIVLDCRDLYQATHDFAELVDWFRGMDPVVLDFDENRPWVEAWFPGARFLPLRQGELPIEYEDVKV